MRHEYPDEDRPKGSWMDVVFALIVLLAAGISTYTTYLGFSKDLPMAMSIPIAAIIGLGLLAINFRIRQARVSTGGMKGAILVFLMIFTFSFLSNTNALYSMFIKQDIVRETQEAAWELYDRETTRALEVFDEDPLYQAELARMAEIENELTRLREQITDPRNPGLGERAREHLKRIEEMLETRTTPLVPPGADAPLDEHEEYGAKLEAHVRTLMAERSTLGVVYGRTAINSELQAQRAKHLARIEASEYDRTYTDEMKRDLKWTENQVNRWLDPDPPLVLDEVNNQADEVGKFKYTWRNFVEWVSPVAIILAVILGALLDVIAPAMTFGLYRPHYD